MAIERSSSSPPKRSGLPFPAVVVIGACAVLGAVTLIQWALATVLGVVRIALFIVVVVAVGGWVVSAKGRR